MAYLNETAAAPVKAATVQSALEDFDPTLGRLENLVITAMNCADRIVGSRPSEVSANKAADPATNIIYGLQTRRERLVRALNALETELQRLDGGLS